MSDIPHPHYRNGGAPPPPPPGGAPPDSDDVYARLDRQDGVLAELRSTVGRFPDINGRGGEGICQFLHDLKAERAVKNAAGEGVSVFLKSWTGRVAMVATVLAFLGGAAAGCVHVAAELHWIK